MEEILNIMNNKQLPYKDSYTFIFSFRGYFCRKFVHDFYAR